MTPPSDSSAELAAQIRSELVDTDPQGFLFNDHVIRQDGALERLTAHLAAHPDREEVERAVAKAVETETDGWTLLKLLEVVERLLLLGAAPALIHLVEQRRGAEDDRSRFLAGRASEVLLKLPLNLESRTRANAICQGPLEEIATFRMSTQRARLVHRPRRVEWMILVALMLLGIAGLIFAFRATG
jgi:hypothetical protein